MTSGQTTFLLLKMRREVVFSVLLKFAIKDCLDDREFKTSRAASR